MDALELMVENINLHDDNDNLKKRVKELETANGILKNRIRCYDRNVTELQGRYIAKCNEADHWKQFYCDLARAAFSKIKL